MSSPWRVPGFVELRELGSGGQGRVVLARSESSGTPVAIKYLAAHLVADARQTAIFRGEAETLARVANPNIARLLGYVEAPYVDEAGAAILMEAVDGASLRATLDEHGALTPQAALVILKGSLLGLAAAHAVGVVHRDYKPANVIVQGDGTSKLIDFGIAGLSGQTAHSGTPAYMAPEQWHGAPASPAIDVYSATCVFYECVTGERPYGVRELTALRAAHTGALVPLDAVPERLRPLVAHGMAKRATERPAESGAFVAELEAAATEAYGPDWERLGRAALGAAAGGLAAAFPFAGLAAAHTAFAASAAPTVGAVAAHGTAQAGSAIAHGGALAQGATHGVRGVLTKIGGAKAGVGATCVAGAGVAAWLIFGGSSGPTVGGVSTGTYHASFRYPGVVLDNPTVPRDSEAGPTADITLSISPARAHAGTNIHVTVKGKFKTPWGLEYISEGKYKCHGSPRDSPSDIYHRDYHLKIGEKVQKKKNRNISHVILYRRSTENIDAIPNARSIRIIATTNMNNKNTTVNKNKYSDYNKHECAFYITEKFTYDFTVPSSKKLNPGKYLLSPGGPPGFTEVRATVGGKEQPISLERAGAQVKGTLPVLTVLEG